MERTNHDPAVPDDLKEWYTDTQIRNRAWESCVVKLLIERIAALTKEVEGLSHSHKLAQAGWELTLHNLIEVTAERESLKAQLAALGKPVTPEEATKILGTEEAING